MDAAMVWLACGVIVLFKSKFTVKQSIFSDSLLLNQ
jgi:hypothetical protein